MTETPYSLEQVEDDLAMLRGEVDKLDEVYDAGGNPVQVHGSWVATDPVNGGPETPHDLGTLSHFTVTVGRYRLTAQNEVKLEVEVTGDGANAAVTTFGTTMAAAYRPVNNRETPLASGGTMAAGDPHPRLLVNNDGTVQVSVLASTTRRFGCSVEIALD